MADEEWLLREEAVEMIRHRLNVSIGRSQALLKAALASGEVRSYDPDPVYLLADDGVVGMSVRPGGMVGMSVRPGAQNKVPTRRSSKDDLLDWLDRQAPQAEQAAKPRKRNREDRAKEAVESLWPNGAPDPAALPHGRLCAEVNNWLKSDCKGRGIHFDPISNSAILRATGRKKR